jgi:IS6 family transposase
LLSALRDAAAAKRLFRQALSDPSHPQLPSSTPTRPGSTARRLQEWRRKELCDATAAIDRSNIWTTSLSRTHRAIKRRVKAKQGLRAFDGARRTIAGYEALHMIRKGQVRWVSDHDVRQQNRFIHRLFDLAVECLAAQWSAGVLSSGFFKVATLPFFAC